MMSNLPMTLITDILSRLAVKPLLRFRCVSKPWCALIDDPDFIRLHLNRSIKTKSNLSLILRDCYISSVNFNSLDNVIELDHPLKCPEFGTEVLGSCDGLICLYNGEEDVCIWNPSTRKHRKLPITPIEFPDYFTSCQYIIYGFGYDSLTDDYKLVRMIQFYGDDWDSFDSEVKVYSLKSNSWRRIQDFPYYLRYKRGYGVLVGSALHWVVSRKYESDTANLVAAFDLTDEKYRLVPQPEFSDKDFHMNVGELDGCLCILCNYVQVCIDMWVMNNYGVKESWTKLFSIAQPQVIRSFEFVTPLAYSKSGREVLLVQDNKKLIWYDLEHKKVKNIKIHGLPEYFETEMCVESLVPLKGGGETNGKKQNEQGNKKKNQKKNGKKRLEEDGSSQKIDCNFRVDHSQKDDNIDSAWKMFDEIGERDLVSWNSLICGYSQSNRFQEVLGLFDAMRAANVKADAVTMVKVILACSHLGDREKLDFMVKYIADDHVEIDVYLGNTLIDMYGRIGSVGLAREVFDQMAEKNLVSWNAMIMAYGKSGDLVAARKLC